MESIRAQLLYTGRETLKNARITYSGTTIREVAPGGRGGTQYPVITPALIDPHCHIGMMAAGYPSSEGEANENMDSILPLADALDSIQMDDSSFAASVEAGVLYSCVLPGSGNIIGGRGAVIRNYAASTSEALIARPGIKGAFGYNPMSTRSWKGTRPYTRMGALSLLRKRLHEVRDKMQRQSGKPSRSAKSEEITFSAEERVLRDLLTGTERFRVHVHKPDDIDALLRFVDEFGLKVTVEHSCDVDTPAPYRELKRRRIPVIYGPVDAFAYKVELRHASWRNIEHLLSSGVEYGLMTDHPVVLQNMLLYQLRWFLRHGLDRRQAMEIVTRSNARILGLRKLGTLEKGKWASFVCWSGDPFDLSSHPVAVYAEGRLLTPALSP